MFSCVIDVAFLVLRLLLLADPFSLHLRSNTVLFFAVSKLLDFVYCSKMLQRLLHVFLRCRTQPPYPVPKRAILDSLLKYLNRIPFLSSFDKDWLRLWIFTCTDKSHRRHEVRKRQKNRNNLPFITSSRGQTQGSSVQHLVEAMQRYSLSQ